MLTELLSNQKEWIVGYHEHDSLLEKRPDENLDEEERKAAWDDYENEKKGLFVYRTPNPATMMYQAGATYAQYRPSSTISSYLRPPMPQGLYT